MLLRPGKKKFWTPSLILSGGAAAGAGEATVLIDVATTGALANSSAGVTTYSLAGGATPNIGSGLNGTSNRCLIAVVMFGQGAGGTSTGLSLIWDNVGANQSFTQIPGAFVQNGASGGDVYLFYLMSPALGAKNFNMTWTGANEVAVALASFVNVDQTGGATSFPVVQTSTAAQGAAQSISISTTPTTRKIIGGFSDGPNYSTTTSQDLGHNNSMNTFAVAACYDAASGGSLNYSSGAGSPAIVAAAIKGH